MLNEYYYHKTIRKLVAAFGTMFNNIFMKKYDENGNEVERVKVPLTYAPKEKFVYDLVYDSTLTKPIQVQLPRMSFEMTALNYDAARKQTTITKILNKNTSNNHLLVTNYMPVPYDFSFDVGIYTRNLEDLYQILEQILPYFTPDFTITVSHIQDGGIEIKRDVPIILESVQPMIQYEGDNSTPRYVQCMLTFLVKAYLFGPNSNAGIIRKAITNIYDTVGDETQFNLVMNGGGQGNYQFEEEVYVGPSWADALWTGRVLSWANTTGKLVLYQVSGKQSPESADVVIGIDSSAQWIISTVNRTPLKHAQVVLTPKPNTANAGNANSFSVNISEFPHIANTANL